MKKNIFPFVLFMWPLVSHAVSNNYTARYPLFTIDKTQYSGKNITIAQLDISTTSSTPVTGDRVLSCRSQDFLCGITGSRNVATAWNASPLGRGEWYPKNTVTTTINGMPFTFNISFEHLQYEYFLRNNDTGAYEKKTGSPGDGNSITIRRCGNLGGCRNYEFRAALHAGKVTINLKVPSGIKSGQYGFNILLGEYKTVFTPRQSSPSYVHSATAQLYASGTIGLPERCFVELSDNNIIFQKVASGDENYVQDKKNITIKSHCIGIDKPVELKVKLVPNSILDRGGYLNLANDSQGTGALGVAYSWKDINDCNSNENFNKDYLIGKASATKGRSNFPDTKIYFLLCKYGIPKQGTYSSSINLTATWKQTS
ncbi:TPA: hypothetical protein J8046_004918 [Escherichia coli]|nr:hypothetical protein [Escherichia coli]HBA4387730.1 hypothetical protein [Escherichia coli]HBB1782143.1 hypothetical protein [Escherichia coli]